MPYTNSVIYQLELGEAVAFEDMFVLRVPGGWLFRAYIVHPDGSVDTDSGTFVPFNDEFQKKD